MRPWHNATSKGPHHPSKMRKIPQTFQNKPCRYQNINPKSVQSGNSRSAMRHTWCRDTQHSFDLGLALAWTWQKLAWTWRTCTRAYSLFGGVACPSKQLETWPYWAYVHWKIYFDVKGSILEPMLGRSWAYMADLVALSGIWTYVGSMLAASPILWPFQKRGKQWILEQKYHPSSEKLNRYCNCSRSMQCTQKNTSAFGDISPLGFRSLMLR